MIARAVVVPYPPLLVPELVGGAVGETDPLRRACLTAVARLTEVTARWLVVAADPLGPRTFGSDARGTFLGFGVDVAVALSARTPAQTSVCAPDPALPLPVLVAGWLRAAVNASEIRAELVSPDTPADECRSLGARLAGESAGLLILGDGSARHGDRAPGRRDDRAGAFDDGVRRALATGDVRALLGLDTCLAAELMAAGRAAWQVLAGAAEGRSVDAELLYSAAPFGVAYHVAVWDLT